jgi:hypothetical protein
VSIHVCFSTQSEFYAFPASQEGDRESSARFIP